MLLFAILSTVLIFLVGFRYTLRWNPYTISFWEMLHIVAIATVGFVLAVLILGAILNQNSGRSLIQDQASLREDLKHIGPQAREMEHIYGQVVMLNRKLKKSKYWNESRWWDWFINDEWASLEPIRIPRSR